MREKRKSNEPKKNPQIRYLEYVFFGAFFVGIILANLYGKEHLAQFGVFNRYFLQQFEYSRIDGGELFIYILQTRIPVLFVLVMFGMTNYWYILHLVFVAWNGAAVGFLFVSGISNLGLKAILLVLVSLLPQYIFYVIFYFLFLEMQIQLQRRREQCIGGEKGTRKIMLLLLGLVLLMLLLFGVLSETYVNPFFMKKVLKIF